MKKSFHSLNRGNEPDDNLPVAKKSKLGEGGGEREGMTFRVSCKASGIVGKGCSGQVNSFLYYLCSNHNVMKSMTSIHMAISACGLSITECVCVCDLLLVTSNVIVVLQNFYFI